MTAFLAAAPFAALAGGSLAHDGIRHLQRAQLTTRSHVIATTIQAMPPESQSRGAIFTSPVVEARWSARDRKTVIGEIPVFFGTPAGTRMWVWTTTSGRLADPPLTDGQVASLATLGQGFSAVMAVALFTLAWVLARKELDRRRYAAWDADWQATDSHGRQRK
jgi:hypothetical protein